MENYSRFRVEELRRFVRDVFVHYGIPDDDAAIGAEILVDADLRGIDSHGVAHLASHVAYAAGLQSGLVNPRPRWRVVKETATTALMDGDGGLGLIVAYRAMELAIRKAGEGGVGMVTVANSRHFGAAGYYSMMALPHDMIGISMTNTVPVMLPTYGRERKVGSNAFSFAVPTAEEPPFVLDIATSAVAVGKLELARREGEPIPQGWTVDKEGNPTVDPNDYWKGGALLPLGSSPELSSHKGYGLGILVDILAGVLSGVGFSAVLSREEYKMGHFFGAVCIDSFRPVDDFKAMMDDMLRNLRSTPPAEGAERVLVPGQKEHETLQVRSRQGRPLHPQVVGSLKELAGELVEHDRSLVLGGGSAAAHTNGLFNMAAIYSLNHLLGNVGNAGGVLFNPDSPLDDEAWEKSASHLAG
ncbi:MAG: Ldh family oxidoreductase, partial [Dehalococcoidia bacterium]